MRSVVKVASAVSSPPTPRAIAAKSSDGPPGASHTTIRSPATARRSGAVCNNRPATVSNSPRSFAAAIVTAAPVITVTREAKAPMPRAMRSV